MTPDEGVTATRKQQVIEHYNLQVTRRRPMLETQDYQCPYCGELVEAVLDLSAGDQQYIEDCPVCCRPTVFLLETDGQSWHLDVRGEND